MIYKVYFVWRNIVVDAKPRKRIYCSLYEHDQELKYNPSTQNVTLIGEFYGDKQSKWLGTSLASYGYLYCIPFNAENIFYVDSRHINEQVVAMMGNLNFI